MPMIRCPNCGTSIDLETRRKTDFNLIVGALHDKPRTFTDLLKMTYLPRKTLSIRLKELVDTGVIMKDHGYSLNGKHSMAECNRNFASRLTIGRKRLILMALLLITSIPIGAQVYAMYMQPQPVTEPLIQGELTARINVYNASDLYSWQVGLTFDPRVLVVLDVTNVGFADVTYPYFTWTNQSYLNPSGEGAVLAFCSLKGERAGMSDVETLATIKFGVIGDGSCEVHFVDAYRGRIPVTWLRDSNGNDIPSASLSVEMEP